MTAIPDTSTLAKVESTSTRRPSRRVPRWLPFVTTPGIVVVFVIAWAILSGAGKISPLVLPSPRAVLDAFVTDVGQGYVWTHGVLITLEETVLGFALGLAGGLILGYFMGKYVLVNSIASPFVIASQVVPKVALMPLFILWFGFGVTSKIAISAMLSFFPILTNVALGVRSVPPPMNEMLTSFNSSRWQRFRKLEAPSVLPYMLAGCEVAIVLSLIGAVVGEYLGGTDGLGSLVIAAQSQLNIADLYSTILLMTLLGFLLYSIVALGKRVLIPWHESVRVHQRQDS